MAFVLTLVGLVLLLSFSRKLYRKYTRISVSDIPGPEPESFVLGNLRQYFQSQAGEIDFLWQERYGGVVRYKGSFGEDRLLISDPKALQYIFHTSAYDFCKQPERREITRILIGRGIVWADGDEHKRHRKIMNPAFGYGEVRACLPVFDFHARKLSSKWKELILASSSHQTILEVSSWFSRTTLDTLGIAALDYEFASLDNADNELGKVYSKLFVGAFSSLTKADIFKQALVPYLPNFVLSYIRERASSRRLEQIRHATAVSSRVAKDLINAKLQAMNSGEGNRDIMSLLVQANASEEKHTQMSEEEMVSQVRSLILAGYETTATSLTWTILELARHPDVQAKLRSEIYQKQREVQARGGSDMSASDFDSMPYLAAVLKESLRFHPVSYGIHREPVKDDLLPLSKPIVMRSGKTVSEIPVPKGIKIIASISGYQRNKDVFGPDAHVYDPDRWITPGRMEKSSSIGVYGNLLTFAGGVRSCIGWRFALLQLQAFLTELVSTFEFSMTPEAHTVRREACLLVMAPTLEGQLDKGNQLPLMVKFAEQDF